MQERGTELLSRAQASGDLRADVTFLDVGYLLELLRMLRIGNADRTAAMRQRHLALIIDGLRAGSSASLPGEPPTWQEQTQRWIPAAPAVSRRGSPARGEPAAESGRP